MFARDEAKSRAHLAHQSCDFEGAVRQISERAFYVRTWDGLASGLQPGTLDLFQGNNRPLGLSIATGDGRSGLPWGGVCTVQASERASPPTHSFWHRRSAIPLRLLSPPALPTTRSHQRCYATSAVEEEWARLRDTCARLEEAALARCAAISSSTSIRVAVAVAVASALFCGVRGLGCSERQILVLAPPGSPHAG
jgi:hypothetical protein